MLTTDMTLKQMMEFNPTSEDMLSLPLEAIVYIKMFVISATKDENHTFFADHFYNDEINECINDPENINIHDFDSTKDGGDKFVSVCEMTSKVIYEEIEEFFKKILINYTHEAFVLVYLYTHDDKKYLISDEDGVIKTNRIK